MKVVPALYHAHSVSFPASATSMGSLRRVEPSLLDRARRVLVGVDELVREVRGSLGEEVSAVLSSHDLARDFPLYAVRFWSRILPPLVRYSFEALRRAEVSRDFIEEFREVEVGLAREVARELRSTRRSGAEDLVYALSVMVDHDLWVLEKVSSYGLEGFMDRLIERCSGELAEASAHLVYLVFSWTASSSAILGLTRYREDNLRTLISWCRGYAEEVDDYVETLDLLADDEAYRDLMESGVVKG